jgi:hypothetical protein
MPDWMKKIEETFYSYAQRYDENIKELVKERQVEISLEELEEILQDAKNMVAK